MDAPAHSHTDRYLEAKRLANEGYGAEDLVVRCHLAHSTAKQMVIEAEYRRLARKQEAQR